MIFYTIFWAGLSIMYVILGLYSRKYSKNFAGTFEKLAYGASTGLDEKSFEDTDEMNKFRQQESDIIQKKDNEIEIIHGDFIKKYINIFSYINFVTGGLAALAAIANLNEFIDIIDALKSMFFH